MRQEGEGDGEGEMDMFPSENMPSLLSHQIRLKLSGEMLIESRETEQSSLLCLFVLEAEVLGERYFNLSVNSILYRLYQIILYIYLLYI